MATTNQNRNTQNYNISTQTQSLRDLAQSHLDEIEAENTADVVQSEMAARDLQKYTKVKRKDRPKPTTTTPPLNATKGAKLRPIEDILDRLRHDPRFNMAEYRVGYLERFEGIKEMAVKSWIAESTDEEWIPQHRIRYVKRTSQDGMDELVWDRESRIDRIFGSGITVIDEDQSEAGGVAVS